MHKITILLMALATLACKDNKSGLQALDPKDITGYQEGGIIYQDFCVQCHLSEGQGVAKTFPPLAGSDWLTDKRDESIAAVKFGQKGAIEVMGQPYNGIMPPMGLSDQEVADVMNYIMNSWGNKSDQLVTAREVAGVNK